ncbi:polysaccharide lyase family 1 protein [Cylindrobasidium torrendii FP15055 ss-10]|uniref:pectin lyase n=1 Tax=Cylindrobasidium torrendii FP15055 ss-10 TaxID=1314674 RepID=A0A0D7B5I1_9AGAR|nr:polysaccharide lyase family 1 protein [Cylindrobasidium torrendii FP15055 ss-10]
MFNVASLVTYALLSVALVRAQAVGTPFGRGSGTTGGGDAEPQTPSSNDELTEWLADDTARVILLDSIFDFTGTEGEATEDGCIPWTCTPNPQLAINANDWCSSDYETTSITYDKAGTTALQVGSNKTLMGSGSNAGIKGKGLHITDQSNIIIQNIKITDINAQYVWGGDALYIDGGSKIWIDHNYFNRIGRQMLVTGYGAVTETTFSNNVLDGDSDYSTSCNNMAYWIALFVGDGDSLTFAQNHITHTAGRGPHAGGTDGYTQSIHIYNNYYDTIDGHAIDPEVGSSILAEGNYFNAVTTPLQEVTGAAYFPISEDEASACSSSLGRACIANTVSSDSGEISGSSDGALSAFTDDGSLGVDVMAASEVPDYIAANAGVGIVN